MADLIAPALNSLTSFLSALPRPDIDPSVDVFPAAQKLSLPGSVPDLIRADGYPAEIHHVRTEDGYTLELHRIPHGKSEGGGGEGDGGTRPPVLFLHCFLCSSAIFLQLGPSDSLAYMLADAGYDVWLLNMRGTEYSLTHETYSPQTPLFWQFSWHEGGVFDTPAAVDFILARRNEPRLDIIGFSMGSTETFVMLSQKPEYNTKVRSLTVLDQGVFRSHSRGRPLRFLTRMLLALVIGSSDPLYLGKDANEKLLAACSPSTSAPFLCDAALEILGLHGVDKSKLPFFFTYFPTTASWQTWTHYEQNQATGEFRLYDHGAADNTELYGSVDPPLYNLSRVTTVVNLIWSHGIGVAVPEDVKKLQDSLPNVVSSYEVPEKDFSHIDFVWSPTAPKMVYEEVLKNLKKLDN